MAYSEKVLDHYERPRNVGTFDIKDRQIGTGMVGAPACGDVMRLQIKVNEQGVIEDARFKTYGCLGSNTPIATPKGYRDINTLRADDEIWAWNGQQIVGTRIKAVIQRSVDWTDIMRVQFDQARTIFCTNDHVWWASDNRPMIAGEIKPGMELLSMTERELRGLNNVGRQSWLREANSQAMQECNATIDFSNSCPNNELIECFVHHNIDVSYVGNGAFWVNTPNGKKLNPDFKVNGQRKLIEVYTSDLPIFMQNRTTSGWMIERKAAFADAGFDVMFINIKEREQCLNDVQRFIHNGVPITSIRHITDKLGLRGLERDGDNVIVYDLALNEGANCFFVQRAMSHNCGSAIASSSLLTEWVKGKTLDQALQIKNVEIAEELALPPVKIHCSVLAEDAIKAAIKDYAVKQNTGQ